jgi:D-3-phosphoglycerate dehydrogenase
MPSVSAEEMPRLKPYMGLAGQLGRLAGQIIETALKSVTIAYEGHAAQLNPKPLTALVLEGLLSGQLASVNMVNATAIARARSIDVCEVRREGAREFRTAIRLTIETQQRVRSFTGTLAADEQPRIVEIEGVPMDARLGPNMLFVNNNDKPGLIGRLGTVLGDAGINIASFHLGRDAPGGNAIALAEIDSAPGDAVIEAVKALPNVMRVKALRF